MPRTSPVHYINPSAISLTANANGSANDIAVYIDRNAKIKVYSPKVGLNLSSGDYQEWSLRGRNRRLANSAKKYAIYARLRHSDHEDGYLVFAAMEQYTEGPRAGQWYEKYWHVGPEGWEGGYEDEDGWAVIEPDPTYWYIKLGEVSLPENHQRTIDLDTGILGTEQFNTEWALNPDSLPLRIEFSCTINDDDAGPTPYVYWGQTLLLVAMLTEGWNGTDIERFDHWEMARETGNALADATWASAVNLTDFRTTGSINLMHGRGAGQGVRDDFNSAVNTTFTVNAMERTDDPEQGGTPTYAVLKSASICIMAETWEKYELSLAAQMVTYNPITQSYSPNNGVKFNIRATDQKSNTFLMTNKQVGDAGLVAEYAVIDTDSWTAITISGLDNNVAEGTVPATAFSTNQQSINVRLKNGAGTELFRTTIAFLRDGEDSKEREWIFLRSTEAITFGTQEHPYPASISGGQVNPTGAATGSDTNKDQDGWVPEGWWDEQQGVDATNRFEYGAYRDYNHTNNQWGAFTTPKIWNHYGQDGDDGLYYKDEYARSRSRTSHAAADIDTSYGTSGWGTTAPSAADTYPYIWKRTRQWNPNTNNWAAGSSWSYTCLTGEDGEAASYYVVDYGRASGRNLSDGTPAGFDSTTGWQGTAPAATDTYPYIWERTRLYNPNTQAYGTASYKCLSVNDAVNVVVAPASMIVEQDINNKDNIAHAADNNLGQFSIQVLKGSTACNITSITASASHVYMSESASTGEYTGDNCRTWTPSVPQLAAMYLKGIAKDSQDNYYSTGQITLSITYTDPDTNTSKTITGIIARVYVNLIGTWSEEVVGDAKTEVAKSLSYAYDPTGHTVISLENMGQYIKSSTQNVSELQQKTYIDILNLTYPATSSNINGRTLNVTAGTYKVVGDFNISNLPTGNGYLSFVGPGVNKTWDLTGDNYTSIDDEVTFNAAGVLTITAGDDIASGSTYDILNLAIYQPQDKISRLEQTADGLTSDVSAIKAGKNLLTGVLTGNGWYSESSVPYDNHPQSQVIIDSDGYMNVRTGGSYICKSVTIERGVDYAMSLYGKVTGSFSVGVWIPASQAVNWQLLTTFSFGAVSSANERRVKTFKVDGSGSVTVLLSISLAALRYPQIERGTAATAFESGDTEVSSRIKQSANEIELTVTDGLEETGIDIVNKKITLDAEKVEVTGNLQTRSLETIEENGYKISIDAQQFNVFNKNGTIGLSIGWDSAGNPYLEVRNADGSQGYKLTYTGVWEASGNFSNDTYTEVYLKKIVNGEPYTSAEIQAFAATIQGNGNLYYNYSAAKNNSTGVYKNDDGQGENRRLQDKKTFRWDEHPELTNTKVPSNDANSEISDGGYMIDQGYYITNGKYVLTPDQQQKNMVVKKLVCYVLGSANYDKKFYIREYNSEYWFCDANGDNMTKTFIETL